MNYFLFAGALLLSPLLSAVWNEEVSNQSITSATELSVTDNWRVWEDGAKSVIMLSQYDAGKKTWTPGKRISSEKVVATKPLVVASAGAALIIWEAGQEGKKVIQGMIKPHSQDPWLGPFTLSDIKASSPQAAMDQEGNALIAWCEGEKIKSVQFKRGAWQNPIRLTTHAGSHLHLSMNKEGRCALAWEKGSDGDSVVQVAFFDPRYDQWSAPVTLASVPASQPVISLNGSGEALALWHSDEALFSSFFNPLDETWSAPHPLVSDDETPLYQAHLADTGSAIALWVQQEGPAQLIYASHFMPETKIWSQPTRLSELDLTFTPLTLKGDVSGNGVALWKNSLNQASLASFEAATGLWKAIEAPLCDLLAPRLTFSPTGNASIIWPMQGAIRAVTTHLALTPLAPLKLTCTRHLSLFLQVLHRLSWEAPQDPSIVAYRVYYDDNLLMEVPATALSVELPKRDRLHNYTYEVKAVSYDGVESVAASVFIRGYQ